MAQKSADAVWLDILPSLEGFAPSLLKGATAAAAKAGVESGKKFTKGFDDQASDGAGRAVVAQLEKSAKAAEAAVHKETQAIAKARAAQAEAAARVIDAEARLTAARQSGDSAKVEAAELRLSAAREKSNAAAEKTERTEEALKQAHRQSREASVQLADAQEKLAKSTGDVDEKSKGASTALGRMKETAAEAGESAKGAAGEFGGMVLKVAALVGAGKMLADGWAGAMDLKRGTVRMREQLDLTVEQAGEAGKAASRMYAEGWGESAGDVTSAVSTVISSISELKWAGADEIASVTKQAQALADVFDVDVTEAARNVGIWLTNGLAPSATDAFDLMYYSLQRVPEALRGEVMDASHEYAQYFGQMGLDSTRMMETLVGASSMGQYAIDKVGDAVKEFSIRGADGSKLTVGAFKSIGLNAGQMARDITTGGEDAASAFQKTVDGLLAIEDPAEQAQAAIALFGTPMEDLGTDQIPYFLESLAGGQDAFEGWQGSATEGAKAIAANVDPIQSLTKSLSGAVSEGLLPFVAPAKEFSTWAKDNPGLIQGLVVTVGALAGALGVAAAAQWVMNAAMLANPFGIALVATAALVAGIALLVKNWDGVVAFLGRVFDPAIRATAEVFGVLGEWASRSWGQIVAAFEGGLSWVTGTFGAAWERVTGFVGGALDGAKGLIDGAWSGIRGAFSSAVDWVTGPFKSTWSGATMAVGDGMNGAQGAVGGAWERVTGFFQAGLDWVTQTFGPLWSGYIEPILVLPMNVFSFVVSKTWEGVQGLFGDAARWVASTFGPAWSAAVGVAGVVVEGVRAYIADRWELITGTFRAAWAFVSGWVSGSWSMLTHRVGGVMESTRAFVADRWSAITGAFSAAWAFVSGWVSSKWASLAGLIGGVMESARRFVADRWAEITGAFNGAWSLVSGWASSKWSQLTGMLRGPVDAGKRAIDDLLSGVVRKFEDTVRLVGVAWSALKEVVKVPIRFVIQTVLNDGLIAGFNAIAGFVGSKKMDRIPMPPGFSEGGYTGPGAKLKPAGIVHAGEVVWSQDDVKAWGGPRRVDDMRRRREGALPGAEGYSSGGIVAGLPGYAGGGVVANSRQGWRGYVPSFLDALRAWAAGGSRTFYMTGNGGTRTRADQERAYALYRSGRGPLAARPGTSKHESGMAIDVNPWPNAGEIARMAQHGLGLTVRGEPWHIGATRGFAGSGGASGAGAGGFDLVGMLSGVVKPLVDKVTGAIGGNPFGSLVVGAARKLFDGFTSGAANLLGLGGGTSSGGGPVKDLARSKAASRGWTGSQWDAIDWIVSRESGWNPNAQNPKSTAYGLFQFLNGTWGGTGVAKTSDPGRQIDAGYSYIGQRYGSPVGAKSFWERNRWYDSGGWLEPGRTMTMNGTGRPEAILTNPQWDSMSRLASHVERGSGSLDAFTPAQIRAALEGMRLRVDLDNGEVWFEGQADRRDRTKARRERARTGVAG